MEYTLGVNAATQQKKNVIIPHQAPRRNTGPVKQIMCPGRNVFMKPRQDALMVVSDFN